MNKLHRKRRLHPGLIYLVLAKPKKGRRKMAAIPVRNIFMHPFFWSEA